MKRKSGKYKKRFILIVALVLLLLIVSWTWAISPTMKTFREIKAIQEQLETLENAPQQIAELRQRLDLIDKIIGKTSSDIRQEDIINAISSYVKVGNKVELCSMPPADNFNKDGYLIKTYSLELQGSFHELVKFIYHFERVQSIGKISSAEFFIVNDRQTNRDYLRLKIFTQSFIKNDSTNE